MKKLKSINLFFVFAVIGAVAFFMNSVAFANKEKKVAIKSISIADSEYIEANFKDLSNLSLVVGALSLGNQPVLDEYAMIHHCEIYNDYFQNDLEWIEISRALKENFQKIASSIPKKYFFKTHVLLQRYNPSKKTYPLAENSVFHRAGILEFFRVQGFGNECFSRMELKVFPYHYNLNAVNPITFDTIDASDKIILEKISALPFATGNQKRLTAAILFEVQGLAAKEGQIVSFSSKIDKIIFYTDDDLKEFVTMIDFSK